MKDVKFFGRLRTSYSVNFSSTSLGQIKLFCNCLTKSMGSLVYNHLSGAAIHLLVEKCIKHVKTSYNCANIFVFALKQIKLVL